MDDTDLIRRVDAIKALSLAAWKHAGTDSYSQGMDAGARHQAEADYEAIRTLPATPAPVVPAEGLSRASAEEASAGWTLGMEILKDLRAAAGDWGYSLELEAVEQIALAVEARLRSAPPVGARVTVQDDAAAFDKADWFWRTMDPDDCGDSPEEAINRAMVGQFCVCEIASSYHGPTRYGFTAPVLDPESDDEEFVHFATQQEAVDAAKARRAALLPAGEGE